MGTASTIAQGGVNAGVNAAAGINDASAVANAGTSATAAAAGDANYDSAIAAFQAAEMNVMAKNIEFQTIQAQWAPVNKVAGANASS